jgi:hypothetical protein
MTTRLPFWLTILLSAAGFSTATTSIATPVTPTLCANLVTLPVSGFPVPNTVITEQLRA